MPHQILDRGKYCWCCGKNIADIEPQFNGGRLEIICRFCQYPNRTFYLNCASCNKDLRKVKRVKIMLNKKVYCSDCWDMRLF